MRRLVPALAGLVAALALPSAAAALPSDGIVPAKAAGVRLVRADDGQWLVRFKPAARRTYRQLVGAREVRITCADLTPLDLGGGMSATSSTTVGYRSPRKRADLRTGDTDRGTDLCAVSTRALPDDVCIPDDLQAPRWCVRVVVPRTAQGRTHLDEVRRHVDLTIATLGVVTAQEDAAEAPAFEDVQALVGADLVALDTQDAAPPRGKVGYWASGDAFLVAAVTAAGVRRFMALDGDVWATNVPGEVGPRDAFGLF